jgi:predicted amidophosphoribosyltransferase
MERKNAPGKAWPKDFPKVTTLAHTWEMQEHVDYKAAKAGDREAAVRLIVDIAKGDTQQNTLKELPIKYPDAIVVPVHAEEIEGRNQIPSLLADYIGNITGLEVDSNIVQSTRSGRTDSGAWVRMALRPTFDGNVQSERKYIIVDDVITQGGTLSEMRRYIEANGGEVVLMLTIGAARNSTIIAMSDKNRLKLERQFGIEALQTFLKEVGLYGGNHEALTASEARQLVEAGTLDEARNRILEARQEGNGGIRGEVV